MLFKMEFLLVNEIQKYIQIHYHIKHCAKFS